MEKTLSGSTRPVEGHWFVGRLGSLEYCRRWSRDDSVEPLCSSLPAHNHTVVLQVDGSKRYEMPGKVLTALPGDFVIVNGPVNLRTVRDGPSEEIVLIDPLWPSTQESIRSEKIVHLQSRSHATRIAVQWVQDACDTISWQGADVGESMAIALRSLLREVITEHTAHTIARLDRAAIEAQVSGRLQDSTLTVDSLAQTFGCSTRTLHRNFGRQGGSTLGRHILHARLDACAERLRNTEGSVPSLTELAYAFSFSSSSHFSTAFRKRFGVSPSAYFAKHAKQSKMAGV